MLLKDGLLNFRSKTGKLLEGREGATGQVQLDMGLASLLTCETSTASGVVGLPRRKSFCMAQT